MSFLLAYRIIFSDTFLIDLETCLFVSLHYQIPSSNHASSGRCHKTIFKVISHKSGNFVGGEVIIDQLGAGESYVIYVGFEPVFWLVFGQLQALRTEKETDYFSAGDKGKITLGIVDK